MRDVEVYASVSETLYRIASRLPNSTVHFRQHGRHDQLLRGHGIAHLRRRNVGAPVRSTNYTLTSVSPLDSPVNLRSGKHRRECHPPMLPSKRDDLPIGP